MASLRAAAGGQFDAFAAADVHFITVSWVARIDARNFDFSALGAGTEASAQALDQFAAMLAERARIPVDRGSHVSSLASFTGGPPGRSNTPPPPVTAQRRQGETPRDQRFDAYSRLVAEAERQTRKSRKR
jgi:hypothetical protein